MRDEERSKREAIVTAVESIHEVHRAEVLYMLDTMSYVARVLIHVLGERRYMAITYNEDTPFIPFMEDLQERVHKEISKVYDKN